MKDSNLEILKCNRCKKEVSKEIVLENLIKRPDLKNIILCLDCLRKRDLYLRKAKKDFEEKLDSYKDRTLLFEKKRLAKELPDKVASIKKKITGDIAREDLEYDEDNPYLYYEEVKHSS